MISIKLLYVWKGKSLQEFKLWFMSVAVYLDRLLEQEPWSTRAFPLGTPRLKTTEMKYTIEENEEVNHREGEGKKVLQFLM